MLPYQERVVVEKDALMKKVERLVAFIERKNENYRQLPLMEKERLRVQLFYMQGYTRALSDRIAYFRETD